MAKFIYRMQNILNLKQMLESQEKAEFALAAARESEERRKLSALFIRKSDYEKSLAISLDSDQIDLKEVNFYRDAVRTIKSMIRDQMFEVKKAQQALDMEREKLDLAMKERKTQEKLKEKAFDSFKQELASTENKINDELTSYRYSGRN